MTRRVRLSPKPRRLRTVCAVGLLGVLALSACSTTRGGQPTPEPSTGVDGSSFDPATTKIDVGYTDSSVPPKHHRSWTLIADPKYISAAVDVYGEQIAANEVNTDPGVWESVVADLEAISDMSNVGEACPGGTQLAVSLSDQDKKVEFTINTCGGDGEKEQEVVGDVLAPLYELVDLEALIDTPYAE